MFSVEEPDPRIGRIAVKSVSWNEIEDEYIQQETDIEMVKC